MKIIYKHDDWEYDRENLEYMLFEEDLKLNFEATCRFLIFGTFFNSGIREFFKGGVNVLKSS